MSTGDKVDGKTLIRVYLLDNSMKTMLVEDSATVEGVVATMAAKVGILNPAEYAPCFSLHECRDGVTIERALPPGSLIVKLVEGWPAGLEVRLVFQLKLFMESIRMTSDPRMIYMLYIQGVYNVITGIYPTPMDEAVSLATLQVQAKFGDHDPSKHVPGFLSKQLRALIPSALLPRRTPTQWQEEILGRHAILNDAAKATPQLLYHQILLARDYYGCAFFLVRQSYSQMLPPDIVVGISGGGIFLLRPEDKMTLERYTLGEIYRWGFKPSKTFYFEVKGTNGPGPLYEYDTVVGNVMSDLLTDYAMMLLKEMKISHDAAKTADSGADAASSAGPGSGEVGHAGGEAFAAAGGHDEEAAAVFGGGASSAGGLPPSSWSRSTERMTGAQAALRLVAMFKGYRVRRQLTRKYAAIKLQSIWRGYVARCAFDAMIEAMEAELLAEEGGYDEGYYEEGAY
jgi:talin